MIKKILEALEQTEVKNYIITKINSVSSELFFVKRRLDLCRATEVCYYHITVYVDSADGTKRGESTITIDSQTTFAELKKKIAGAVSSAKNSFNPFFELPEPEQARVKGNNIPLKQAAMQIAEAIFEAKSEKAFVNSVEIFAVRRHIKVISSRGTDVAFYTQSFNGEYVVQCKQPQDVELHNQFQYDCVESSALTCAVNQALQAVEARAVATKAPETGVYTLILGGKHISTLLDFYTERADASTIYSGYSDYAEGKQIQGEITGEGINLTLKARAPYDLEGIKKADLPIIKNGTLTAISGSNRFCRYLGKKPVGVYGSAVLDNGTKPMSELLRGKCLYIVAFSDFQCDSMDGVFGGEIRLAYLYEDGKVTPLTGGSLSGNLLEQQGSMEFSTERYVSHKYSGPMAVRIANVTIAGEN